MRRASVIPPSIEEARARFFARVKKGGPDDCWEWQGERRFGYGRFRHQARRYVASRVALHFDGRSPGEWECACHTCDNPPCCNPTHLFVGTESDNQQDRVAKERGPSQRGEHNPQSRLTSDDIRAIRAASGTLDVIGAQFGIGPSTASQIRNRRRWSHVA